MSHLLHLAAKDDLDRLLPMVRAYHQDEGIDVTDEHRRTALEPLLNGSPLGAVWFIGPKMSPVVYVADADLRNVLAALPFADICITSQITVSDSAAPENAFRLPEVEGVAVHFAKAEGEKCARCWKILPDVGTHDTAGVCGRCDSAVSERAG